MLYFWHFLATSPMLCLSKSHWKCLGGVVHAWIFNILTSGPSLVLLCHYCSVCALCMFVITGLPWTACIRLICHEWYCSAGLHCSHGPASSWSPHTWPASSQVSFTYRSVFVMDSETHYKSETLSIFAVLGSLNFQYSRSLSSIWSLSAEKIKSDQFKTAT